VDAIREELGRLCTIEERHRRLASRLVLLFLATIVVDVAGAVAMYALEDDEKGWAGETGRRVRYAVCDAKGPRTLQVEGLLPGTPNGTP